MCRVDRIHSNVRSRVINLGKLSDFALTFNEYFGRVLGAIHIGRPHQRGEGGSAKSGHLRTWGEGGSEENADVRKMYDLSKFFYEIMIRF